MSSYPSLKPLFASAIMVISNSGHFYNTLIYDYEDLQHQSKDLSYRQFIQNRENYREEQHIYWKNMQSFLDAETNIVNNREVQLNVVHCGIHFRTPRLPFVQWIIEFDGQFQKGKNFYENYIEPETLEYPIHSIYHFSEGMKVKSIQSSLKFKIHPNMRTVEYSGKKGDKLTEYERIEFIMF